MEIAVVNTSGVVAEKITVVKVAIRSSESAMLQQSLHLRFGSPLHHRELLHLLHHHELLRLCRLQQLRKCLRTLDAVMFTVRRQAE